MMMKLPCRLFLALLLVLLLSVGRVSAVYRRSMQFGGIIPSPSAPTVNVGEDSTTENSTGSTSPEDDDDDDDDDNGGETGPVTPPGSIVTPPGSIVIPPETEETEERGWWNEVDNPLLMVDAPEVPKAEFGPPSPAFHGRENNRISAISTWPSFYNANLTDIAFGGQGNGEIIYGMHDDNGNLRNRQIAVANNGMKVFAMNPHPMVTSMMYVHTDGSLKRFQLEMRLISDHHKVLNEETTDTFPLGLFRCDEGPPDEILYQPSIYEDSSEGFYVFQCKSKDIGNRMIHIKDSPNTVDNIETYQDCLVINDSTSELPYCYVVDAPGDAAGLFTAMYNYTQAPAIGYFDNAEHNFVFVTLGVKPVQYKGPQFGEEGIMNNNVTIPPYGCAAYGARPIEDHNLIEDWGAPDNLCRYMGMSGDNIDYYCPPLPSFVCITVSAGDTIDDGDEHNIIYASIANPIVHPIEPNLIFRELMSVFDFAPDFKVEGPRSLHVPRVQWGGDGPTVKTDDIYIAHKGGLSLLRRPIPPLNE